MATWLAAMVGGAGAGVLGSALGGAAGAGAGAAGAAAAPAAAAAAPAAAAGAAPAAAGAAGGLAPLSQLAGGMNLGQAIPTQMPTQPTFLQDFGNASKRIMTDRFNDSTLGRLSQVSGMRDTTPGTTREDVMFDMMRSGGDNDMHDSRAASVPQRVSMPFSTPPTNQPVGRRIGGTSTGAMRRVPERVADFGRYQQGGQIRVPDDTVAQVTVDPGETLTVTPKGEKAPPNPNPDNEQPVTPVAAAPVGDFDVLSRLQAARAQKPSGGETFANMLFGGHGLNYFGARQAAQARQRQEAFGNLLTEALAHTPDQKLTEREYEDLRLAASALTGANFSVPQDPKRYPTLGWEYKGDKRRQVVRDPYTQEIIGTQSDWVKAMPDPWGTPTEQRRSSQTKTARDLYMGLDEKGLEALTADLYSPGKLDELMNLLAEAERNGDTEFVRRFQPIVTEFMQSRGGKDDRNLTQGGEEKGSAGAWYEGLTGAVRDAAEWATGYVVPRGGDPYSGR